MTRAIELRAVADTSETTMRIVTSLAFEPDGVTVEFVDARDVKTNGVMLGQSLFVPHADQYDDEIDAVMDAVQHLLGDVLEDFTQLPAKEACSDDDDAGMGE